jgi:hypothetical protein
VLDNGQGNKADPDQFDGGIVVGTYSNCCVATPNSFVWGFIPNQEVLAPESVKVIN